MQMKSYIRSMYCIHIYMKYICIIYMYIVCKIHTHMYVLYII